MAVARVLAAAIALIMLLVAVLGGLTLIAADELFNRAARFLPDGRRRGRGGRGDPLVVAKVVRGITTRRLGRRSSRRR
jgi:hypothetical protein